MFAVARVATGDVVTGNVAVVAPPTTVTLAGTWAAELSLARATPAPPVGAGADNVTVPVEVFPPRRLVGFRVSDASETGLRRTSTQ